MAVILQTKNSNSFSLMKNVLFDLICTKIRPIRNTPTLVQTMTWRRLGDTLFPEPIMASITDAYVRHSASMI